MEEVLVGVLVNIMIENGWLEQPPQAIDRDKNSAAADHDA
jgi:hypothetical protein